MDRKRNSDAHDVCHDQSKQISPSPKKPCMDATDHRCTDRRKQRCPNSGHSPKLGRHKTAHRRQVCRQKANFLQHRQQDATKHHFLAHDVRRRQANDHRNRKLASRPKVPPHPTRMHQRSPHRLVPVSPRFRTHVPTTHGRLTEQRARRVLAHPQCDPRRRVRGHLTPVEPPAQLHLRAAQEQAHESDLEYRDHPQPHHVIPYHGGDGRPSRSNTSYQPTQCPRPQLLTYQVVTYDRRNHDLAVHRKPPLTNRHDAPRLPTVAVDRASLPN